MDLIKFPIPFFFAASSGSLGAWFVYRYAAFFGLIDQPNHRSSHDRPTPKGGGIGILIAFSISCILLNFSILFWGPVTFLSLLSLYGDKINIKPILRLAVQFSVTILFLITFTSFKLIENDIQSLYLIILWFFISTFIVGTSNFYNFMDGINGIAGITGIVGFGLLGFFGKINHQNHQWVILSFVMAFACIGFLPFNIPKAKVFMGDVGSILLGFVFACIVVVFAQSFSDFVILVSFMFPFYIDELFTMLERIIDKQNLTIPHRRHFYQILANEGKIEHWKVSVGYGISQFIIGVNVWLMISKMGIYFGLFMVAILSILLFIINRKVKKLFECWVGNTDCQNR
ncbi:UDP-GlcNAc--UDP-phosphate GlcNAc-1-phosphate transferase [Desulfosarcina ovata subsp. sediminis]|uniref:UDP-GlcNAc--UDP-phosphate GlcNAc-1-phosphate transferase n=1 Tax=Desulfosarcina ovata subsp. sediminis TaxID=885957 RepID=A0A5K7ZJV3_9BACT|nr:glycosyltransferase family 4 protein [Desulfosarcina ovata]BBO80257.1 UDP-GlcNAc--UDP-phosphate GlcNAc-1-phosphate transferase [Desulfosarcina ovata subsp. sediminis]